MTKSTKNLEAVQSLFVCARIRPMSCLEISKKVAKCCYRVNDKLICVSDPPDNAEFNHRTKRSYNKTFIFDHAFDESCSQEDVFQCTTLNLIQHVANGFNATVFANGATGAGKTYTMVGTDKDPGIMVRSMEELFKFMSKTEEDYKYRIKMAYMELYNETLRDLLEPNSGYLELREDARGVQAVGLHEVEPANKNEVFELLHRGNMNRTTEATGANATSSRSHAILQISVCQKPRVPSLHEEARIGKLFLIDLAGSERAAKTLNRGKRMTEGAHINRSLLALGNCINALADSGNKRYVNYRDSKLTRLLKDALAGNCQTVMIAHLSPSSWNLEETWNTLAYADRAKCIKTKVRRNVFDVKHHISEYTHLIDGLHEEITRLKNNFSNNLATAQSDDPSSDTNNLKEQLVLAQREHLNLRCQMVEVKNRLVEMTVGDANEVPNEWPSTTASSTNLSDKREMRKLSDDGLHKYLDFTLRSHLSQQDLASFRSKRTRLEAIRRKIERNHEISEDRVHMLQQALTALDMRKEEREIVQLLCRLHELELERADLNARFALSGTELKRHAYVLDQFICDCKLSEAIIHFQSKLLTNHKVERPKELERLLELYAQQHQPNSRKPSRMSDGSSLRDLSSVIQWPNGTASGAASESLPSLPNESASEDNCYLRTAKWLEAGQSRRASDTEEGILYNGECSQSSENKPLFVAFTTDKTSVKSGDLPSVTKGYDIFLEKPRKRKSFILSQFDAPLTSSPAVNESWPQILTNTELPIRAKAKTNKYLLKTKEPPVLTNTEKQDASSHDLSQASVNAHSAISSSVGEVVSSDNLTLNEQRKCSLRKLNHQLRQPVLMEKKIRSHLSRQEHQGSHSGLEQTDVNLDWTHGPLTRPIKIVPMEITTSRKTVSPINKTPRARATSSKSGIPRSKSTPNYVKSGTSQKVPQFVKQNDQLVVEAQPHPDSGGIYIGNAARRVDTEMPVRQTPAVDGRSGGATQPVMARKA